MISYQLYLLGLVASATASPTSLSQRENNATNTTIVSSFKDVPITKDIQYIPCFENYTCTQLEVPLDYDDMDAGTTNIAFLKYEALEQPAMGDIIFNPGGPGDGGISNMIALLPQLLELLGNSWNLVGMDPRGVSNSGPLLDCFGGKPWLRDYYYNEVIDGVDPRSNSSLAKYYEGAGTFGTWCTQNLNKTAKYVNTPATATDMLRYAELLAESQGKSRDEAKVDYYGASYGTVLGTTFAALYPNRVGKFLIDAVVDGNDYYRGNWSQNLLQADASVEAFFKTCAEAGPLCAFYRNGSTASDLKERFDCMLADVEKHPVPVTDPLFVQFPTVITHIDVRNYLMLAVYNPPVSFPKLAVIAAGLEKRNGSIAAVELRRGIPLTSECNYKPVVQLGTVLPKEVIACNDNNKSFNGSEQALFDLFKEQKEISTYLGDTWPLAVVPLCRLLDTTPPKNQLFSGFDKKIKTSTPILFADNVLDPVTSSGELMSKFFEGSGILLQEAVGHGLIVTTSNCTSSYVQNYFKTGQLPPKNTTCESDFNAFPVLPGMQRRGLAPHHPALRRHVL